MSTSWTSETGYDADADDQTRASSAFCNDDWILSKTGTSQRNIGGAVLHAGRGPQPHAQGEDKDAAEHHLPRAPSLERVERVEQQWLVPLVRQHLTFPPNAELLTSACVAEALESPGLRLSLLVIVLILLGLPMIHLAVLLLVRSQR